MLGHVYSIVVGAAAGRVTEKTFNHLFLLLLLLPCSSSSSFFILVRPSSSSCPFAAETVVAFAVIVLCLEKNREISEALWGRLGQRAPKATYCNCC